MKENPITQHQSEYKKCPNCERTRHITAFRSAICKLCEDGVKIVSGRNIL